MTRWRTTRPAASRWASSRPTASGSSTRAATTSRTATSTCSSSRRSASTTSPTSPFTEMRGVLTPDGRKLVFLSDRADGVNHLFVVAAREARRRPGRPAGEGAPEEGAGGEEGREGPGGARLQRWTPTGIRRRAVQLTRGEEPAGSFFVSADGKLVYFTSADDKGRGLFSVTIDGKDRKRVADGVFASLAPTARPQEGLLRRRTARSTRWNSPARRRSRASSSRCRVKVDQPRRVGADVRRVLARDEVPLLRREDARRRLGRHQGRATSRCWRTSARTRTSTTSPTR